MGLVAVLVRLVKLANKLLYYFVDWGWLCLFHCVTLYFLVILLCNLQQQMKYLLSYLAFFPSLSVQSGSASKSCSIID
jgi:hypothetical protein